MRVLSFAVCALIAAVSARKPFFQDCDFENDNEKPGKFGNPTFFDITYDGTVIYGLIPEGPGPYPLLGFMHGSTGQWEMYQENLTHFASHGFVVVFPHIRGPKEDTNPLVTNTNGEYLIKAINWAIAENSDKDSQLYGMVDSENVIYAGHSMGATCSIKGSHSQLDDENIKLTVAMHPGICGPLGPPPSPATWETNQMAELAEKHPVFMTTAKNDGAFWPAPATASHEKGCFEKSFNKASASAQGIFIDFKEEECEEDDARSPFPDGGHCCPLRNADGGKPENPWLLVALKLYG